MRFLVDASCDARLATHLRDQGHDVKRIGRDAPGDLPDQAVLELAHREQRILITMTATSATWSIAIAIPIPE